MQCCRFTAELPSAPFRQAHQLWSIGTNPLSNRGKHAQCFPMAAVTRRHCCCRRRWHYRQRCRRYHSWCLLPRSPLVSPRKSAADHRRSPGSRSRRSRPCWRVRRNRKAAERRDDRRTRTCSERARRIGARRGSCRSLTRCRRSRCWSLSWTAPDSGALSAPATWRQRQSGIPLNCSCVNIRAEFRVNLYDARYIP